ncbi:MAG: TetR/AcrR family transcriptional regulator [Pseudomonadota bacterium]
MAGLRARQKADRERRILEAAVTTFRAKGYRAARIEELAHRAEVSVGTVYNYYQSKGEILVAVVAMEVEEVLAAGAAMVANPPEDVDAALLDLVFGYFDHSLKYLSKEMWRFAMALSIESPQTPSGRRYTELDQRLADQVTAMIAALQKTGEVRPDLAPGAIGTLLFNNLNQEFTAFVKDEAMPLEILHSRVSAQTRPVARMIATR